MFVNVFTVVSQIPSAIRLLTVGKVIQWFNDNNNTGFFLTLVQ